jgi:hypothetical protein
VGKLEALAQRVVAGHVGADRLLLLGAQRIDGDIALQLLGASGPLKGVCSRENRKFNHKRTPFFC